MHSHQSLRDVRQPAVSTGMDNRLFRLGKGETKMKEVIDTSTAPEDSAFLHFNDRNLYPSLGIRCMAGSTPGRLKESKMISHDEFVLSYENGRAGCSVSALLTLRLFFAGKIREKWVSIRLLFWSLGFLALTAASGIVFLSLPVLWALLGTIAMLAIYALAFFYSVGGFVLSAALANEEFYEFAKTKHALWIYSDDQEEANAHALAAYAAASSLIGIPKCAS
jgi:hypothetical protein